MCSIEVCYRYDDLSRKLEFRDRRSRKAMGNVHCVTHPIPLSELEEDEVLKTLEKEYYERDFDSSSHELKVRYNHNGDRTEHKLFCIERHIS